MVFYSWMSDRPDNRNRSYFRQQLQNCVDQIAKKLKITIRIDSDSRGEDGSQAIDEAILKKINACDLFVCDITPMVRVQSLGEHHCEKEIPNPNVLFELGFAVASLGWHRCIMIWNGEYGDLNNAPFDIRNHTTVSYRIGSKELQLNEVLKKKIENYDELVKEWRTAKERSYDASVFARINKDCSEQEFVDSIHHFLTNRVFSRLNSRWWSDRAYNYKRDTSLKFNDEELHIAYCRFLDVLEEMESIAYTYNEEMASNAEIPDDIGSEEWERLFTYKITDPYDRLMPDEARDVQQRIDEAFQSVGSRVIKAYDDFRALIRKKLLI